jgi:hypothetical protein
MFYYLVEKRETTVGANPYRQVKSRVNDDGFDMSGYQPVEVDASLDIDHTNYHGNAEEVFDYQSLLSEKYNGLLAQFDNYNYVERFDLLSNTLNTSSPGAVGSVGGFSTYIHANPYQNTAPLLASSPIDISSNAPGSFNAFRLYWSVYTVQRQTTDSRVTKTYHRASSDSINAYISNDGGSTTHQASHLEEVNFASSGNTIQVLFENTDASTRHYLGDFGFLY